MNKDIKNKIKKSFEEETPDFRESVILRCKNESQVSQVPTQRQTVRMPVFYKKLVAIFACVFLFGIGIVVGNNLPILDAPVATSLYLDVNPAIEVALDSNDVILSCTAINEDAETILDGVELKGAKLQTGLNTIISSLYVKGYLSQENNSILISVDGKEEIETDTFLSLVTQKVKDVFKDSNMECAIIAQEVKANKELENRAKEKGVSVGKMHLVDKMISEIDELTEEDLDRLTSMNIKDLNLIYSTKPNKDPENEPNKEIITGSVNGFMNIEQALEKVLEFTLKQSSEVESYKIFALPSKHGQWELVYAVTIKFKDDQTLYKYDVNCETGAVIEIEQGDIGQNPPPHQGGPEGAPDGDLGENPEWKPE